MAESCSVGVADSRGPGLSRSRSVHSAEHLKASPKVKSLSSKMKSPSSGPWRRRSLSLGAQFPEAAPPENTKWDDKASEARSGEGAEGLALGSQPVRSPGRTCLVSATVGSP
ncbi:uncharacterized protein LOC144105333 [Amblyomma americanum]